MLAGCGMLLQTCFAVGSAAESLRRGVPDLAGLLQSDRPLDVLLRSGSGLWRLKRIRTTTTRIGYERWLRLSAWGPLLGSREYLLRGNIFPVIFGARAASMWCQPVVNAWSIASGPIFGGRISLYFA